MPRKKSSLKTKKTKKIFSWRKYFFLFLALFAIGIGSIAITDRANKPECANSESCINDLSGKYEEGEKLGYFNGEEVKVPKQIAAVPEEKAVLGETDSDKKIYIDLSAQRLYAKEGDRIIYEFLISSGKWGRTPTGEFTTWIKLRSTRMAGGSKELGTYYNLPNVPYTMYFYNAQIPKWRGFGIHGAYWHNNFGHPMSHGCINMKPEEARLLYVWANPQSGENSITISAANPGTPISIYGTAPWQ